MTKKLGVDDVEDLSTVVAQPLAQHELIENATEATFVFADATGWPRGVTMTYLPLDGRFWFTSVNGRRQVDSLRRDDRASIVISSAGTSIGRRLMLSYRGRAFVRDDADTKARILPLFAARIASDPEAWVRILDSPNRAVIEFVPAGRPTSHDSAHLPGDGRGGSGKPAAPNTVVGR
jgi:general stress protein 26